MGLTLLIVGIWYERENKQTSRTRGLKIPIRSRRRNLRTIFFFFTHIYFPASGQAVVTGVVSSSPRFLPHNFYRARGSAIPLLVDFSLSVGDNTCQVPVSIRWLARYEVPPCGMRTRFVFVCVLLLLLYGSGLWILLILFLFFLSSGGQGKIKLKLTTLPRICVHVVCRFNSSTGHRLTLHWVAVHIQQ